MTYNEIVGKLRTSALRFDASEIRDHIAIQFNIYGEGEGAFYIEINEGKIDIQPYEYFDRDALIYVDANTLIQIASGELTMKEAYDGSRIVVQGRHDAVMKFGQMKFQKRLKKRRNGGIFHRVSIRKYKSDAVEPEKVKMILQAAMAAPSACNQQPWEYYVVTDKETIQELSAASPYAKCAADAPVVFVPCYRKTGVAPEYFEIDMSASVENLLLEADELGLGTVWMGIAPGKERMDAVRKVLDIPAALEPFALVPCGYPAEEKVQEDRFDEARVHYVPPVGPKSDEAGPDATETAVTGTDATETAVAATEG